VSSTNEEKTKIEEEKEKTKTQHMLLLWRYKRTKVPPTSKLQKNGP